MVLPIPATPIGYNDQGARLVKQATCRSGFFDHNMPSLWTIGLSSCSCVALYYANGGRAFGALIHYDLGRMCLNSDAISGAGGKVERCGNGEAPISGAGRVFDAALTAAGFRDQTTVHQNCSVFLAFSERDGWAMTGKGAWNDLTDSGYNVTQQYHHNGSTALDASGNFFDPCVEPPVPLQVQGAAARRRHVMRCVLF